MAEPNLTQRQQKWFASVRASLERDTGRSLAEWVEIARACPETGHRARLKWFKDNHGLLQNRASQILSEAFPSLMAWSEPAALVEALWTDPACRAIYEALNGRAMALPDTVGTARKTYAAWSRKVQYAAARPVKGGRVMLGLAVAPETAPGLEPPRSESWSERLKSRVGIASPAEVDERVVNLLKAAWKTS
jgi:hypothetical protein